ncbi:MAG: ferritin-like domain-containing protein [Ferruginibacter sp.]
MKSSVKTQSQNGVSKSVKTNKTPAKSDAATGLRDFFEDSLKDIYWAEKALTKAIPKMIKNATSEELLAALTDHLEVTKAQVARLDEVFASIEVKAQAKKCAAMEGLIKEGEEIMESTEQGVVRDAGIIAAGQKIEHYEIATYGTLCAFAKILGEDEAANLLTETLAEEKDADKKLSEVAESAINIEAAKKDEEEGEDVEDEPTMAPPKKSRSKIK